MLNQTSRQVKRLGYDAQAFLVGFSRYKTSFFPERSGIALMLSRPLEIAAFLDQNGWEGAAIEALKGDFSTRRYARLKKDTGETAFFMDADEDQKTPAFVTLAETLSSAGIKAPKIYAANSARGLVLIEDFGTHNVGRILDAGEAPLPYFMRAAEVLAKLHRAFGPAALKDLDLPTFDSDLFTSQAELFLDAYFLVSLGREASEEERRNFCAAWKGVLKPLDALPRSLMLRDFMPDNLMDLPGGDIGVLDFQDAGIGPIAYDLASLCEEVRRDGGFSLLPDVISRYRDLSQTPLESADLLNACAILSAQRHMRILGIIARLSFRTGQCGKFAFLPRIRQHLEQILNTPALLPVKTWVENFDGLLQ